MKKPTLRDEVREALLSSDLDEHETEAQQLIERIEARRARRKQKQPGEVPER